MSLNKECGIAIVGCGTVGSAAATILMDSTERFRCAVGQNIALKALVSKTFRKAREVGLDKALFAENLDAVLTDDSIHVVVETVGGLTEAHAIVEKSLKAKKHVVTANKALLAHYGEQLFTLARDNGVSIGFEASCAGGIPIIRALVEGLSANTIDALYGIVNGTSNFILTEMVEHGKSYQEALKQAQRNGLAEADPALDVDGTDAAHKLTLLASLAFGGPVPLESIPVKGIDSLDIFDVSTGRELGYVLKLLAFARRTRQGVETAVKPVFLSCGHLLAQVSGPFNAVSIYGNAVGHTMYYGRGAGGSPTASAIIADILSIAVGTWPVLFPSLPLWTDRSKPVQLADADNSLHRYYLRFDVEDRSGVIADIASELARRNISMNSFVQKEYHKGSLVPIVILTHTARTQDVSEAFEAIKSLSAVSSNAVSICIIDEHIERHL